MSHSVTIRNIAKLEAMENVTRIGMNCYLIEPESIKTVTVSFHY